jgi:hypothetical protein
VPSKYIPPDHSLIRYVSWAKLRKDGENEDKVIGILPDAFRLRPGEGELSAAWLEFYDGDRTQQIKLSVEAFKASKMKIGSQSGFTMGCVKAISDLALKYDHKLRIIHEREEDLEAHVAVRGWPEENQDLFDELADGVWADWVLTKDISL